MAALSRMQFRKCFDIGMILSKNMASGFPDNLPVGTEMWRPELGVFAASAIEECLPAAVRRAAVPKHSRFG